MTDDEKIQQLKKTIVVSGEQEFIRILESVKGVLQIDSVAGPIVGSPKGLSDKDRVLFYLFGVRAGKVLKLDAMKDGTATIDEMRHKLGIRPNILRMHLSLLTRENKVFNATKGGKGKKATYAITDFGVQHFKNQIAKKLMVGQN